VVFWDFNNVAQVEQIAEPMKAQFLKHCVRDEKDLV
jgi:hypothetical protein